MDLLLVPEPPEDLSKADKQRIGGVRKRAGAAASTTATTPKATEVSSSARGAVTEPEAETQARAQDAVITTLDTRPPPHPKIEELCQRIYEVIRSKRPPDEDSLVDAEPEKMAQEAGSSLDASVQGDMQRVQGDYNEINNPPEGTPTLQPTPIEPIPGAVETGPVGAGAATPGAVPAEDVSLEADVAANRARIDDAGMNTEPAQLVQSGPVAEARQAQGELQEAAERDPAEVVAEMETARAKAGADMASLQASALEALAATRSSSVGDVTAGQRGMVGSEQDMREQIGRRAKAIFESAQERVNAQLTPLPGKAMERWNTGVNGLSFKFKQRLKQVEDWIDERHSGGLGAIVSVWDAVTGLPGWVTREYNAAEQEFGDDVCNLVRDISRDVEAVIATCEAIIAESREQITNLYTKDLPEGLEDWAAGELAKFNTQLDGLHQKAMATRDNFNRDLVQRASQAVQDVRQQIHELRKKAGGLVGRIVDAVNRFIEDPIKFIIDGLLELVGIAPASFWALVNRIREVISDIADDPLGFASNLLAAVGEGFSLFFKNIGTHLLNGLLEWLFSGLGKVGVKIPADFSLKSIITFILELMGISWARIRKLLAKHIGEENIALIEKAFSVVADLIAMGPEGLFELIKDKLNPQTILDMILKAAVDFLIEALIKQVTARIILLFNPVGAIVQAIEAIYRVLKWIFENAARIFTLIETIVNGIHDILQGNISGMAKAVERALASLIAPVIDFLADYLSLGDLPDKIADTIKGFQDWIEGILDQVIGWLVAKGKELLKAVGLGGKEDEKPPEEGAYDGQIGKVVTWTVAGERHRLWIEQKGSDSVVMVASEPGTIDHALSVYRAEARKLGDEDPDTAAEVSGLIEQASTVAASLNQDADALAQSASSDNRDQAQIAAKDDAVEAREDELRDLMSQIQTALGLDDDADIQKAKNEFGDRLFSASEELGPLLKVSNRTVNRRTAAWQAKGVLFRLASAGTDPYGLYSFDPTKAGQRDTHPNNRSKYGYSNPSKASAVGLKILSKGFPPMGRRGSPNAQQRASATYHMSSAHYFSTRPGSSYTDFTYPDAILGHKEGMGASDHWKEFGHKQTRADNQAWNRDPDNYQGPEHKTESAASGAGSERYIVPSKAAGSHPSWW